MITADTVVYANWRDYQLRDVGPAGGWIFYIDEADVFPWTGLEAAPASTERTGKVWGGYDTELGVTATAIGTGAANTAAIVAALGGAEPYEGKTDYAAKVCADLVHGGYSDWFLPSKDELNLMYVNLYQQSVGGFSYGYWSSSESSSVVVWLHAFDAGFQATTGKPNGSPVRAARAF